MCANSKLSQQKGSPQQSVPGLCLQEQSDLQGVLPEWHGKDTQCNKEASFTQSAEVDPTFGNSDGESLVPMANVNIAEWLSAALTNLWTNHTQAVTLHKRKAQSDVVRLFRTSASCAG
jgi:hypothetical protein